jgi:hypothetical protein
MEAAVRASQADADTAQKRPEESGNRCVSSGFRGAITELLARTYCERSRMQENADMGDERLRAEIRDEQERIISAVRSATDHWEMAKAQDSFADLLERMADELEMSSAHDRGRFLAAAHALRQSAALNEQRYVTGLSQPAADSD